MLVAASHGWAFASPVAPGRASLRAALTIALLGSAFAALPAGAAPLTAPSRRHGDSARAEALRLAPDSGPARHCGTRLDGAAEILRQHLARASLTPLPTTHSTDAGEIAVLEDDGTFFFPDKNGNVHVDLAAVSKAFYRTHGDDYDVLGIFLSSGLTDWLGSPGAFAAEFGIRNAIQGIGLPNFDYGAQFGSPARLSAILSLNGLHRYPADPYADISDDTNNSFDIMIHELGHRWLSYVWVDSAGQPKPALLGRDYQHWNFYFDSDSSYLEGSDWARVDADSFHADGVTNAYGTLDLYLMGLASKAETDSFFVINEPSGFNPPGTYTIGNPPVLGLGCRGRATYWHVGDIEAVEGVRVPDAASAQHAWRMGVILVTANGNAATQADLAKAEAIRGPFAGIFSAATRGKGSLDLTLDSRAGSVVITHRPLADTENALAPRPAGCRARIAQAGIPIGLDPSSVAAFWRPAGGSWTQVPFASAGGDSFAGMLPALPGGGAAEYYLHAASDSAGIDAYDPPGGAAAPHVDQVGPDVTPPVIVHIPVHQQAESRLPQTLLARVTDNLGVDSVWAEYSVDAGPTLTAGAAPAGLDSFAVSLGNGLSSGHSLAYRFAARDRSTAHNLAYSNQTSENLAVGKSWFDDFENGPAGYLASPVWFNYRDAWHSSQQRSSPPGGTAWKCGAWDAGAYPPQLDANLHTPFITDLPPGTLLRFDHWYDLERANSTLAWDGARIEAQVGAGPWTLLTPPGGYSHHFVVVGNPFAGTGCWSGNSGGWRTETFDLSALSPGPARIRFRMIADELIGYEGWYVDRVRLIYPGTLDVPLTVGTSTIGRPMPNPARNTLRLSGSLARSGETDWSLYDVSGRRVATLWKGALPAGAFEMSGAAGAVPAGLYFSRLTLGGREIARSRVAIVR